MALDYQVSQHHSTRLLGSQGGINGRLEATGRGVYFGVREACEIEEDMQALGQSAGLEGKRVVVQGFAETRPLVENDSPQNRAKNRRVELILTRGIDEDFGDLKDLQFN